MPSMGCRLHSGSPVILVFTIILLGLLQQTSANAPSPDGTSGLFTIFRLEKAPKVRGYQAVLHGCLNVIGDAVAGDRACDMFYISGNELIRDYISAVNGEKDNTCQIVLDVTGPIVNGGKPNRLMCRAGLPEDPDTLAVWDADIPSKVFRNSPKANHYYFLNSLVDERPPSKDSAEASISAYFSSLTTRDPPIFWMSSQTHGVEGGSAVYTQKVPGAVPIWIRYEVRERFGYRENLGPRGVIRVMKSEPLTAGSAGKVSYGPFQPAGELSSSGSWVPGSKGDIFYQTVSESNGKRYSLLESREGPCGKGSVLNGLECSDDEKQIRFPLATDGSIDKIFYVLPQRPGEPGSQWLYFTLKEAQQRVDRKGVTPWKLRLKWVPAADP